MTPVAIVTDSTVGLPDNIVADYSIRIVSMGFVLNNKVYRDYLDIKTSDFWQMFPKFLEIPTTSAASLGDFRNTFIELSKTTHQIVCITISDKLSATHKAAVQAAQIAGQEIPGLEIKVIDSQTSSGALALIVLEAARAARSGKGFKEVIQVAENMLPRAKYLIMFESLKYIMKVGRAPIETVPAAYLVSPIMGIVKPNSGVLENLGRAANIDQAIAMSLDMVKDYVDAARPIHFILHYPDRPDKCEEMKRILSRKYNSAEILIGQWAPATIVATGPMWGMGFFV